MNIVDTYLAEYVLAVGVYRVETGVTLFCYLLSGHPQRNVFKYFYFCTRQFHLVFICGLLLRANNCSVVRWHMYRLLWMA